MRFLITGGAGFLGVSLANHLIGMGHHVRVIDDLSAGDPARLSSRVLFTRGDVRDVPKLWTLLHGVDCVFHMAARVLVPESVFYPRDYNDVNVGGTVALMEAIRDAGTRRVVLASSATIYGVQPDQPLHEEMRPNPQVPYAVSKLAAEHYVFTLGALHGIETVALRIFNAYGPGQRVPPAYAPVVPQLLKQAQTGGSLVVFGNGEQTRDFVYVDDVVHALVAAGTSANVDRQVINVGSGHEVSINQLIRAIGKTVGRRPDVLYNSQVSGGVPRMVAQVDKAAMLLAYAPRMSLELGLAALLQDDVRFKPSAVSLAS